MQLCQCALETILAPQTAQRGHLAACLSAQGLSPSNPGGFLHVLCALLTCHELAPVLQFALATVMPRFLETSTIQAKGGLFGALPLPLGLSSTSAALTLLTLQSQPFWHKPMRGSKIFEMLERSGRKLGTRRSLIQGYLLQLPE